MSDDVLKLIPTDPEYVPSEEAQQSAVAALERLLPEGEMCEAETYDRVTFIDQGENLEAVICSGCNARLELYEGAQAEAIGSWWGEVMESLEELAPGTISVEMPCCRKSVQLVSLRFDWPAGFARFELSIWNPSIEQNLSAEQLTELQQLLGCNLTQVRAHY